MNSQPPSHVNISIGGSVNANQVALGQNIRQVHVQREPSEGQGQRLSPDEWQALLQLFAQLQAEIQAQVPAEERAIALKRVEELQEAVTEPEPDLDRMEYVKRWFAKHLPKLTGAVTGVIVNPIVGKLVEAAGDMVAGEFRDRFQR